ncbi:tyrosine-type recombinase/integrase [Brevibacillus sp. NPDC058079]|uniref:tyrosine-type recombinase/integrase n=1 Tax=Brevibacillus sp. NPDC058079 TaxID=3346330 RepID=UPI0036E82B86
MTVKQWIRLFLSNLKHLNKSPNTIRTYGYDLEQFLLYIRNNKLSFRMDTHSFKKTCIRYFESLHTFYDEDQQKEREYDEASINRKRSCIRSFVRFLFTSKYISEDFSDLIEFTRKSLSPPHCLLNQIEIQTLTHIHDQRIRHGKTEDLRFMHRRNKLAFLTLLYTGIKVWEVLLLKWSNIHFEKNQIVVPKRKGLDTRIVHLSPLLALEFRMYLDHMKKLEHFDDSFLLGYIFFGTGKTPTYAINPKTIERMIDSIVSEACITHKNITSQSLRHTMAHHHLQLNKGLKELTPLLGYSRNSVTKHMYLRPASQKKQFGKHS